MFCLRIKGTQNNFEKDLERKRKKRKKKRKTTSPGFGWQRPSLSPPLRAAHSLYLPLALFSPPAPAQPAAQPTRRALSVPVFFVRLAGPTSLS